MNEGTASGPHHEDRSDRATEGRPEPAPETTAGPARQRPPEPASEETPVPDPTPGQEQSRAGRPGTPAGTGAPDTAVAPAPEQPARPLHPQDPYGTPPYGGPGPWAPAPPVQRPVPTPPHGVALPPQQAQSAPPAAPQPYAGPPAPAAPGAPQSAPQGTPRQPQPYPQGGPLPPAQPGPQAHTPSAPLPPQGGPQPQPPSQGGGQQPQPQGGQLQGRPQGGQPLPLPQVPLAGYSGGGGGPWERYDPWAARDGAGEAAPAERKRGRGRIVAGAVVLALVAGGVGGGVGAYIERSGGVGDVRLPQVSGEQSGRAPDSVAGIARSALPGVVTLHVRGGDEEGTGTGFVLDRRGHLLTNNHVVEAGGGDAEITVTFSGGETATGSVVGRDSGYDLAVVKVDGAGDLKPLTLGNSDDVRVGDPVVAIGAPFDLANTVTSGIISAKQRPITAGGESGDGSDVSYVDALQTDAPINPGNSGGPLVDGRAHVIGINSAIRAAGNGDSLGGEQGGSIGLGFAIPINQGKRVAEELINTGRATHPVIGVTLDMGYSGDGARVSAKSRGGGAAVTPGGPGARAGIKAGDLITQVDGGAVHSGEELIVKIRSHRPGDRLKLTVERNGHPRTVRITLGSSTDQN
ncbi:trypsin-like peptidase domain-containing protein [Streptomyces sp. CA-132043]|uniref:S1C family serine protease n=1 Tax=Streptomyces sp. CA-132043 TaxID=3240048 RepID=UPI003D8EB86D